MKKIGFVLAAMLYASSLHAAQQHTEAEIYAYHQAMQSANRDWNAGRAQAAFQTIKAQADLGFPEAQYILATLYHDGEGTPQDLMMAAVWYQKAADQTENAEIASLARTGLMELRQH